MAMASRGYYISDQFCYRQKQIILPVGARQVFHLTETNEQGAASLTRVKFVIQDTDIAEIDGSGILEAKAKGKTTLAAYVVDRYLRSNRVALISVVVGREALDPLIDIPATRYVKHEGVLSPRAPAQDNRPVVLRLTGDMMCEAKRIPTAKSLARKSGFKDTYDFRNLTEAIAPYIRKSDFSIGNLESVLADQYPYFSEQPFVCGAPLCNAPSTFLDAINQAGFDAVVTANNHVLDCGELGFTQTLKKVESYGLFHTGVFPDEREKNRFLLADVHGIRIAVINYNLLFNRGVAIAFGLTDKVPSLVNIPTRENFIKDIAEARESGAEFVVVFMHWGLEENSRMLRRYSKEVFGVTQDLTDMAQAIADAGADYIVGAGAHALHKYDVLVSAEGKSVPCAYEIGNFIADMDGYDADGKNDYSMILSLKLSRQDGQIVCEDGYIPCCMEDKNGAFFTRVITETDGAAGQIRKDIATILTDKIRELPESEW